MSAATWTAEKQAALDIKVVPKSDPNTKRMSHLPTQAGATPGTTGTMPEQYERDRDFVAHYVFAKDDPFARPKDPWVDEQTSLMPERHTAWSPPMDVLDLDKELVFHLELPGVEKKDIDIAIDRDDSVMIVTGEKSRVHHAEKSKGYRYAERHVGPFERRISIPKETSPDQIRATLEHGVLRLAVPKPAMKEKAQAKQRSEPTKISVL